MRERGALVRRRQRCGLKGSKRDLKGDSLFFAALRGEKKEKGGSATGGREGKCLGNLFCTKKN